MNHVGVSINGGISVLSAFANGRGASVAIDLPMEIVMRESNSSSGRFEEFWNIARRRFGISGNYDIEIKSKIPQGNGLKSSSALITGLLMGIDKIFGLFNSMQQLAEESAEISKILKLSYTGAFDDICSCIYGGLCYCDNRENKLIKRFVMKEMNVIVIPGKEERSSFNAGSFDFTPYMERFKVIEDMIIEGRFLEAMKANGEIFMEIYGDDKHKLDRIRNLDPLCLVQSGKGPAIFAVFKSEREADYAYKELENFNLSPIRTSFSNEPARVRDQDDV